jgi:hypothetical protein
MYELQLASAAQHAAMLPVVGSHALPDAVYVSMQLLQLLEHPVFGLHPRYTQ